MHIVAIHDRPARDLCGIHAFVVREGDVYRMCGFRDRDRVLTRGEVETYVERGDFGDVDVTVDWPHACDDVAVLWVGEGVDDSCDHLSVPRVLANWPLPTNNLESGTIVVTTRTRAQRILDSWMLAAADRFLETGSQDTQLARLMVAVDHRSWLALAARFATTPASSEDAYLGFLLRDREVRKLAASAKDLGEVLGRALSDHQRLAEESARHEGQSPPFLSLAAVA